MADIAFDGIYKLFGPVVAVEDLSLEIRDGEFLVLVGPSGCGKTTSLRMLAGFERPTYGTVSIGGQPQNKVPPQQRDLAMVFQSYALYPHMTVYKNLAFGMKVRREPRAAIRPQVEEVAKLLGIEALLGRRPAELSGGQRQRVALGRALLRQPRAFLMDEPLSNLDAALRVQMRVELKRLHERFGITTVYVTHDQVEAMTMGDRIAIMNDGRLQQADTPRGDLRAPRQPVRGRVRRLAQDEPPERGDHERRRPPGAELPADDRCARGRARRRRRRPLLARGRRRHPA